MAYLYRAIVQYKDSASRKAIETVLEQEATKIVHEHQIYILAALEKFPDKIFNGLKEGIIVTNYDRIEVDNWKEDRFD